MNSAVIMWIGFQLGWKSSPPLVLPESLKFELINFKIQESIGLRMG